MKPKFYPPYEQYVDQRIGRLIVKEIKRGANKNGPRSYIFACECACGNSCEVSLSQLVQGASTCGCGFRPYPERIGETYGSLKVQDAFRDRNNVMYRCLCACGSTVCARANAVVDGDVESCGCLGKGPSKNPCGVKSCKETAEPYKTRCSYHLKQGVETGKRRRERCKRDGICFACNNPATHGVYCERHHDLSSVSQTEGVRRRRQEGLCVSCGKVPRPGKMTCQECAAVQYECELKRKQERIAQGLCVYCGAPVTPTVGRPRQSCDVCREIRNGYTTSIESRFSRSKSQRGGKPWTITLDEYRRVVTQPCHYCGLANDSLGCGLDRLNNKRGYDTDNVVSCCTECNMVRNNIFSPEEMHLLGAVVRQIKLARAAGKSADMVTG